MGKVVHNIIVALPIMAWLLINWQLTSASGTGYQIAEWRAFYAILPFVLCGFAYSIWKGLPFSRTLSWSILLYASVESLWALLQVFELAPIRNSIFHTTGSFYNPGPLGGILAMCLPIAVHEYMNTKGGRNNICLFASIFIGSTILLTHSRIAMCATMVGIAMLFLNRRRLSRKEILLLGGIGIVALVGITFLVKGKILSAYGRFIMLKICLMAISRSPWTGNSSFAEAFSEVQEEYFSVLDMSKEEILAAGSPGNYAFCSPIEIAIYYGIPVLLLCVTIYGVLLWSAYKQGLPQYACSLVALGIFSLASYPIHITLFWVVVILISLALAQKYITNRHVAILFPVCSLLLAVPQWNKYNNRVEAFEEWERFQTYYYLENYRALLQKSAPLWDKMAWNSDYIFRYGLSLHKTQQYDSSNVVLSKMKNLTTDPMPLNIMALNHQKMGRYEEAECLLLQSTRRLPNRIYPHCLLYRLYGSKEYLDSVKMRTEEEIIFNSTYIKESKKADELRYEIRTGRPLR